MQADGQWRGRSVKQAARRIDSALVDFGNFSAFAPSDSLMMTPVSCDLALSDPAPSTTWFDRVGCVVRDGEGVCEVFVGGRLLGSFGPRDTVARNLLLIAVSEAPHAHFGHIARAFDVSSETIRLLRQLVEREGVEAVARRTHGGSSARELTARDRKRLVAAFEQGMTVEGAWDHIRRRASRSTVGRLKKAWEAQEGPPPRRSSQSDRRN